MYSALKIKFSNVKINKLINYMVFDRWVICRDYMVQIHDYVYVGNN